MIKHRCPKCSEYIEHTITERRFNNDLHQKRRPLYYPLKDETTNKIIWKNLFRIDMISLLFLISILLISFGVHQINTECYTITKDPCTWSYKAGCLNCFKPVNNSMEARWNLNNTLKKE